MVTATLLYNQGKALELPGLVKSQSFAHRNGPLIDNAPQERTYRNLLLQTLQGGGRCYRTLSLCGERKRARQMWKYLKDK